jgi:L-rhamnose mutarotase
MKHLIAWGMIIVAMAASFVLGAATNRQAAPIDKPVDNPVDKPANKPVKYVGMVVGIKPDKIAEYKRLHSGDNCRVRDLLTKYHMHNFSIFLHEIDGKWYEFGYYEYTGDDYDGDMAKLAAEPRNQEWLSDCDPMQLPLKGEKSWATMERAFFNP